MNVSRASVRVFLGRVGTTLLSFVALAYLARELGSAGMGVFFLFQGLLTMLATGTDAGLATAVEKRISGGRDTGTVLSTGGALILGLVAVVAVVLLVARGAVNEYVGAEIAALLAVGLALRQVMRLLYAGVRGDLRVGEIADLQVATTVAQFGVAAALVAVGVGPLALVVGVLAGTAAGAGLAAWKLRPSLALPSPGQARSLLSYAKYNIVPSIGLQVHNWMDVLVIGWFLSQSAVGVYEIAWRVAGVTTLLAGAIGASLLPQASAWEDAGERVGRLVSAAFVPALVLIVPATFGTVVLASDILELIFGAEFGGATAAAVLVVLVAGKAPEAIQIVVGKTLLGLDRPDLVARATVATLVLNLVGNVTLIPEFGLLGGAAATTLSFTVGMYLRVRYLGGCVPLRFPARKVGWCVLAAAAMAAVVTVVRSTVTPRNVPQLFALVGLGGLVYAAAALIYPPLRRELIGYLSEFLPDAVAR